MRFHLIDALRGVAALWVVLFHAHEGGHLNELTKIIPEIFVITIFDMGESGVPIFFVLSGFVITHSLMRDSIDGTYIAKFALRRSVRLDPPYWASIVLVVFTAWLSASVKSENFDWPSTGALLAHVFYLQGILEIPQINTIYWTLCLEIQFYLVMCALLYFAQRLGKYYDQAFITVFSFAAVISLLWPTGTVEGNIYPGLFFPHWHAFLLGVFSYCSWQKRIPSYFFYSYLLVLIYCVTVNFSIFSTAACAAALFVHECARSNSIQAANWRWIQFSGMISYSLYLTHNPITGASYYLFYSFFGDSIVMQAAALFVSTATCIIFAYVFWWLFERWSLKVSKKIPLHLSQGESNKDASQNDR